MKKYFRFNQCANSQSGIILVSALIMLAFFMVITIAIVESATSQYASSRRNLNAVNALAAAEAGGDSSVQQLVNTGGTYTGNGSEQTFTTDAIQGKVTYFTTVTAGTISGEKIVTSIGRVYQPQTASTPLETRTVRVVIQQQAGVAASGYNIQTGSGGLTIQPGGATTISGPIYIGGKLVLAQGDSGTMDLHLTGTGAGNGWYILDKACGSGATYPTLCTSGSLSATIQRATLNAPAGMHATNTVFLNQSTNSGTPIDTTVPAYDYPVIDHDTLVAAHTWPTIVSSTTIPCGGTIAANTHFTNASGASLASGCTATVMGDVWVDGPLALNTGSSLLRGAGLATQPKVIVDGFLGGGAGVTAGDNVTLGGTNGLGIYAFYSSGTGCSPHCTTLTGSQLSSNVGVFSIFSQTTMTVTAGTILYSRWGSIVMHSTNFSGAQIVGQSVTLGSVGPYNFAGTKTITSSTVGGFVVSDWQQL